MEEALPTTGKITRTPLVSINTSIEAFREVDLERVDPGACLEYLNSQGRKIDFVTSGGNSPAAQPYGVSDRGAEFLVRDRMTYFGMPGAEVTDYVGDGGVDVVSDEYVAQVKNYTKSVAIESVRSLFGVATKDGRKPLFFTSGWFSSGAVEFANQVGMALFIYDAKEASCKPASRIAEQILNGIDQ